MTNQGGAAPGWYPDPYDPQQLRYWDGMAWSESVAPASGPPASYGAQAGPVAYGTSGSGLGDVGDWFSRTFRAIIDRLVPVLIFLLLVPSVGFTLAMLLAYASVANVTFDTVSDSVDGFALPQLLAAIAIGLATLVLWSVTYLAGIHQLWAAHADRAASMGASLSLAVRRLPRTIAYGLLLGIGMLVLYMLMLGLPAGLAFAASGDGGSAGAGFLLLYLLTIPAFIVVAIWLWVRLSLWPVATVVAPGGSNPVGLSWRATAGRFWPFFGRLLLLWVVVWVAQFVSQSILNVALTPLFTDAFGFSYDEVTGEALLDGRPVDSYDSFRVGDFVPNPALLLVLLFLYNAVQAAATALQISGAAGLYVRSGSPAPEG